MSLPIASHAGQVTMKWKDGIAEGQHKQDVEEGGQGTFFGTGGAAGSRALPQP